MPPPVENTALLIFGKFLRSGAFNACGLGKEIFIPSSVKKIGSEAFTNTSEYFKNKMRSSAKTCRLGLKTGTQEKQKLNGEQ